MARERLVRLTDGEIESLMGPWDNVKVLEVDDDSYTALRKLQDAAGVDEELSPLTPPGMDLEGYGGDIAMASVGGAGRARDIAWFVALVGTATLDGSGEEPVQQVAHQLAQNTLSRLIMCIRHGDSKDRIIDAAAILGRYAMEIALRVRDAEPWPEEK